MKTPLLESLTFGDTTITYRIQRSDRRRTLAVTVNPDTTVTVAAPNGLKRRRIAAEVRRKAAWIVKRQDWLRRHHPRRPRQFVSGETYLYLGRQYHLRMTKDARVEHPKVYLARGCFWLSLPPALPENVRTANVRGQLMYWYREHAAAHLELIAATWAKKLGVTFASTRALELKTRWGSGSPDGQLRFNWRIIMAPRRLIEYIVTHELCHIVHNGHSPAFWRLLARVMPDYEQRRQQLATSGPIYDF
jgi:predicted metal-dependent hydrolase